MGLVQKGLIVRRGLHPWVRGGEGNPPDPGQPVEGADGRLRSSLGLMKESGPGGSRFSGVLRQAEPLGGVRGVWSAPNLQETGRVL